MVRNLLAVVAGFVIGSAVIGGIQYLGHMMFPPPPGLDPSKPEDLAKIMEHIKFPALLMVEISYLVGSLAAGFTVGKIARVRQVYLAIVLGVVYTGFNLVNLVQIPTPLWLALLTTVTFLPCTWLGARLAVRS